MALGIGDLVGFEPSLSQYKGFAGKTGIIIETECSFSDKRLTALKAIRVLRSDGRIFRLLETDIHIIQKARKQE